MMISVALAAFLNGFNKAGVAGTLGSFVTAVVALSIPAYDATWLLGGRLDHARGSLRGVPAVGRVHVMLRQARPSPTSTLVVEALRYSNPARTLGPARAIEYIAILRPTSGLVPPLG